MSLNEYACNVNNKNAICGNIIVNAKGKNRDEEMSLLKITKPNFLGLFMPLVKKIHVYVIKI